MKRVEYLKRVKRIVIKVGTSVISTESGRLDSKRLKSLAEQISKLKKREYEVLLVTSGAIAAGMERLGFLKRPTAMSELQAAASVGQGLLIERYANFFKNYDVKVGQVLITQHDITHRGQYLNARNTLEKLLELGVVPVINENDTTAVDEIRFGDNDTLAALVSNLINADMLIILSDTEGLYTAKPCAGAEPKVLSEVSEITEEIEALAGGVGTKFASGGMVTKIQAARIVTFARSAMVITNGTKAGVLLDIMDGKPIGTYFAPRKKKVESRKLWIAFGKLAVGTIYVDEGAKRALVKGGKSLLPAGVVRCEGKFEVGDAVNIAGSDGKVFAKGLSNFTTSELNKIKGLKTDEISKVLKEVASEEVAHRDCLCVLK